MHGPRLARYDIVEEVGRGGMSVVYRAHDRQLHREVAVKVLHQFLADDADARLRFRREALAVARLRHPNILEIYDSSEPGANQAYLVTELITGETLRAWLERHGPPDVPEIGALVVLALARALRHAHEQGILHRDLKPENVMVTTEGHLKLMDFGIAQIIGGSTRLTTTGTLLGSPAHMAPEVIDGAAPDHRADLFSLGTILYWVLTGALPFQALNPSALFRRILEGRFEPIQMLAPKVGNALARIVERSLEPSVEARYQDISELETDLERALQDAGIDPSAGLLVETLLNPGECAARLEPDLVARWLEEGRAALSEGAYSRAADRLNRVLAFRPDDPVAVGLLARATRSRPRAGLLLAAGGALAVVGLGIGLAWTSTADGLRAPPAGAVPRLADPPALGTAARSGGQLDLSPAVLAAATTTRKTELRPIDAQGPAAGSAEVAAASQGALRLRSPSPASRAAPKARTSTPPPAANVDPQRPKRRPEAEDEAPPPRPDTRIRAGDGDEVPETWKAPSSKDEAEAAEVQATVNDVRTATLRIRIGRTFANIRLNGRVRLKDSYHGVLEIEPGLHQVEVVKPGLGRFAPRAVELTSDGALFEHLPDGGRRPLVGGVLDFRVPLTSEEAATTPGWKRG